VWIFERGAAVVLRIQHVARIEGGAWKGCLWVDEVISIVKAHLARPDYSRSWARTGRVESDGGEVLGVAPVVCFDGWEVLEHARAMSARSALTCLEVDNGRSIAFEFLSSFGKGCGVALVHAGLLGIDAGFVAVVSGGVPDAALEVAGCADADLLAGRARGPEVVCLVVICSKPVAYRAGS
jgi:hypothetical protein